MNPRDLVQAASDSKRSRRNRNRGRNDDARGFGKSSVCLSRVLESAVHSQMSHQTGARMIASFRQTTAFTNWLRQAIAVQIMYAQVPTFHACKCHGRGIKTKTKLRNAKMGKSGYVGSIILTRVLTGRCARGGGVCRGRFAEKERGEELAVQWSMCGHDI